MNVSFSSQNIFSGKYDGVALFTYEERSDAESRFLNKLGKNVLVARDKKEFKGEKDQVFVEIQPAMPRFYLLVGLGKRQEVQADVIRKASSVAARKLRGLGAKSIAIEAPQELDASLVSQAVTEGAMLSTYNFKKYKTQKLDEIKELDSLTVVSYRTGVAAKIGVEIGKTIAESCNLTRDLQNTPATDMPPATFANIASKVSKKEKLKCKILDRKQLEKQSFNGVLAVGRGSVNEPRLITIEHSPKNAKKTIAVVGKGITFDTGGISIKPSPKMGDMKFDMSGAAVVLGVMRNSAKLKIPVRVIGIMALAENMPDGKSYKPGDVVTTKSGKTIEVDNTDAEGRIVLADALHHATTFKPDIIVDLATLTGAVLVALGDVAAGVMGNNQKAVEQILSASRRSGEKVWQLPAWDDYQKDIESSIADVKNVGMPRLAGTIAAGMLLKEFVDDVPWVHIDIAGVAWADSRDIYFTKKGVGGTAFGVRLVTELLRA